MRDFRKLRVWKEAIDLSIFIYEITSKLPDSEKYGLKSQMERCSISIASNIAEGASRRTSVNFAHFLEIAIGSSFELETQLTIARRLDFIDSESFQSNIIRVRKLEKGINALRSSILLPRKIGG